MAWFFTQAKTAFNSYRAKRRAEKYNELWLKKMQDAYLREYIRLKMEQYKKENNIVE